MMQFAHPKVARPKTRAFWPWIFRCWTMQAGVKANSKLMPSASYLEQDNYDSMITIYIVSDIVSPHVKERVWDIPLQQYIHCLTNLKIRNWNFRLNITLWQNNLEMIRIRSYSMKRRIYVNPAEEQSAFSVVTWSTVWKECYKWNRINLFTWSKCYYHLFSLFLRICLAKYSAC